MFHDESTSSSLMYNLDSYYGFEKEASGLTVESSSFLCHVLALSKNEESCAVAKDMVDLVVHDAVHYVEQLGTQPSQCCASWHQGKRDMSQVSLLVKSNHVLWKEPEICSARAELVFAFANEPHPMCLWEMLPGCV